MDLAGMKSPRKATTINDLTDGGAYWTTSGSTITPATYSSAATILSNQTSR